MKKNLALLLALLMLLSGCKASPDAALTGSDENVSPQTGEDGGANQDLGIAYVPEDIMHPLKTRNKLNLELFGLIYEGLFEIDESFTARPVLCESFYLDNGSYYFKIRSGVLFGDGSSLTARDAEYSLKLAKEQESYYANRLSGIKYIKAVDDTTLEVRIDSQNGRLESLLDIPIVKSGSGDSFPAGTGAYSVWQNEDGITLVARENWWKNETPKFNHIKLYAVNNLDELIYNFESFNIDVITMDSTGNPIRLRGDYETRDFGTTVMQYIGFNMKRDLFKDSLIRQAFSCLIDRESAAIQDFAGLAEPALLPLHPRCPAYSQDYAANIKCSVENAKSLFAAAGITDTDNDGRLDYGGRRRLPVTVSILVNRENKSKTAVCHRIAEALKLLGIDAVVREEKWEDYLKALQKGDFDVYYAEVNLCPDFIIDPLFAALNYGGFPRGDFGVLLDGFNAAPLDKDNAQVKSFYMEFALRVPFVPVLFKKNTIVTHRSFFETLTPTQQNTYYAFSRWK